MLKDIYNSDFEDIKPNELLVKRTKLAMKKELKINRIKSVCKITSAVACFFIVFFISTSVFNSSKEIYLEDKAPTYGDVNSNSTMKVEISDDNFSRDKFLSANSASTHSISKEMDFSANESFSVTSSFNLFSIIGNFFSGIWEKITGLFW